MTHLQLFCKKKLLLVGFTIKFSVVGPTDMINLFVEHWHFVGLQQLAELSCCLSFVERTSLWGHH